eukprot:symbB.v1.2.028198.t1/scaffold2966.1/size66338/3
MAVREVSAHDSFRLLKTHMPEFVDRVGQVVANGRTCDVWIPQTWPSEEVPTDHNAPCKVMADHLLPPGTLVSAQPPLLAHLQPGQLQPWLQEHRGKTCIVQGDKGPVEGIASHFVVIEENPAPVTNHRSLQISAVRKGEEVTYQGRSTSVPLQMDDVKGLVELLQESHLVTVALLLFCRALHITELSCTMATAGSSICITEAQLQLDETAGYLCQQRWGACRFPKGFGRPELPEERLVQELDARTGASLKFTLLNRMGRVWTLIAGGGASVVYTDTICDYGFAKDLANYGEYSGDPPEELVYEYAKIILGVMTSSPEPHGKVLLIGGGVANFTDVASTFKGIATGAIDGSFWEGAVVDTLAKGLKQPFAFIIPANDKVAFDPSLNLKLSAVHEIVVQDSVLGTVYKRQIVLAQTQNCILFKLPTPEYKATLTEKFELVLEAFTCLLTKESLASFTDKPYDALKARVSEQCPSIAAQHSNLYGFRRIPDQCHKDHFIIQAMCRVTKESRIKLLEMSGAGDVFVRNFVPKEGEKSDVTVIPKFWPSDRSGRDESLRAAGSLEGFAGIISTRRGIAVRAWCAKVACVRKVLLSNDDRINEINIDTIPVDLFDSTGWPANISPGEIVRAVHHSCKLPAIPTRCFRAMGVTTWTLGFEKPPSTLKCTASFNNEVCEILLTKTGTPLKKIVGKQPNAKKNFNHVKADSSKSAVGDSKDENASRITALETPFSAMERRQDGMEERLQTNFDGIQNQLRQLLNAVQPRSASPARTGMTPPTKVPKAS